MEDIFTQLKKAQRIQMTAQERDRIRQTLIQVSAGSSAANSVRSPQTSPYMTPSPFTLFGTLTKAAAFLIVGFIAGGASLSFASLNSLPGDRLYSIKTGVTEKITTAFAFSTESKTRSKADHVATRVSEIAAIKQSGAINDARVASAAQASFTETFQDYTTALTELKHEGRVARSQEIALATLTQLNTVAPAPVAIPAMSMTKIAVTATPMNATIAEQAADTRANTALDTALLQAVGEIQILAEPEQPSIPTDTLIQLSPDTLTQPAETTTKQETTIPSVKPAPATETNASVISVPATETAAPTKQPEQTNEPLTKIR